MKISESGLPIGKVAAMFGITTQALRNRIKQQELQAFFSDRAKGKPGKPSLFDEQDFSIALSVNSLLAQGFDWQDIAAQLRTGWRETNYPESAAVVASSTNSAMNLAGRALSAEDRLELLLDRLQHQDAMITRLHDQLIDNERAHTQHVETIMRELAQAQSEKAAAERELRLLQQGWRPPTNGVGEGSK